MSIINSKIFQFCHRVLFTQSCNIARSSVTLKRMRNVKTNITKVRVPLLNSGIQNTLQLLKSDDLSKDISEEELEDLGREIDVTNIHIAHDDHVKEMDRKKEMLRLHIIGHKYFKTHEKYFVTWEERQHIRYLHESDPEKWNFKELAQAFPVTEEGVKKIIKSNWKPRSKDRIAVFNKSVKRNWKLLLENKLDISEGVRSHILKFTPRQQTQNSDAFIPPTSVVKPTSTEFVSIVRKNKEPEDKDSSLDNLSNYIGSEDLEYSVSSDTKHFRKWSQELTFNALKEKLSNTTRPLDTIDQAIVNSSLNQAKKIKPESEFLENNGYEREITPSPKISKKGEMQIDIPQQINIPKQYKYKGKLFKVNDCYYDRYGEFLYRVPGV